MQHITNPFTWPDGRRAAISLSFDDARPSQLDQGLPVLDAYDVKATFYVCLTPLQARLETWRQVAQSGHEIGNHTLNHPCSGNFPWSRLFALEEYTLEQMQQEIVEANSQINSALGLTPVTFAYPCGQRFVGRGEQVQSYVPLVARHFRAGRSYWNEAPNDPAYCDLAQLNSLSSDDLPFADLKAAVDKAIEGGHWLIFTGHDVGAPSRQSVHVDALEALCDYILSHESDLWSGTVAEIAAYVQQNRNGR